MQEDEIKKTLIEIKQDISQHRSDSRIRDLRLTEHVNKLSIDVKRAQETADKAHAMALDARHAAHRVSESSEGADHSIFAELGSLKVVIGEHTVEMQKNAKDREERLAQLAEEKKLDKRARAAWRIATPTIVAAITVIANQVIAPSRMVQDVAKQATTQTIQEIKDGGQ